MRLEVLDPTQRKVVDYLSKKYNISRQEVFNIIQAPYWMSREMLINEADYEKGKFPSLRIQNFLKIHVGKNIIYKWRKQHETTSDEESQTENKS